MTFFRGNPDDFDAWGRLGNEGWSWKDCLKYFKKLESLDDKSILKGPTADLHCTNGALGAKNQYTNERFQNIEDGILSAFEEIGEKRLNELNTEEQLGCGPMNYRINTEPNTRASSLQNYLMPIKDRKNLYILKETLATKILIKKKTATGVQVKLKSGEKIKIKAEFEVILSAGTYQSPKLLQLSGIGPKTDLESKGIKVIANLPVGENLQDHAFVPFGVTGSDDPESAKDTERSLSEIFSFPIPALGGSFSLKEGGTVPDIQHITIVGGPSSPLMYYILRINFNYNLEMTLDIMRQVLDRQLVFSLVVLARPKSKGRVVLRSIDPEDSPMIYHNYLSDEDDLNRLVAGVKKLRTITGTSYFKKYNSKVVIPSLDECQGFNEESEEFWRCYARNTVTTTYHPVGTCKMAPQKDGEFHVFIL